MSKIRKYRFIDPAAVKAQAETTEAQTGEGGELEKWVFLFSTAYNNLSDSDYERLEIEVESIGASLISGDDPCDQFAVFSAEPEAQAEERPRWLQSVGTSLGLFADVSIAGRNVGTIKVAIVECLGDCRFKATVYKSDIRDGSDNLEFGDLEEAQRWAETHSNWY